MSTRNIYKGFPNRVSDNIRIRAGWLARSGCIPNMEAEDIEQDLALDLLQRLPAYDSSRASVATFADRVIGNRVFTDSAIEGRTTDDLSGRRQSGQGRRQSSA
jgi:hypothetical protein